MDKEQAKKEYERILAESSYEIVAIIEEAKKNGTWKPGLDTNEELFAEHTQKTKRKIEELIRTIE